jgi:hypothetical protein
MLHLLQPPPGGLDGEELAEVNAADVVVADDFLNRWALGGYIVAVRAEGDYLMRRNRVLADGRSPDGVSVRLNFWH